MNLIEVRLRELGQLFNSIESWASRTGFILATVGSAVGIGSIWMPALRIS